MKRTVRAIALALPIAGAALGLSACSHATPALSQCEMTTNGGFGSNGQGITNIVHPGGKVSIGNGETAWYFPCNARNFVTAPSGGDRGTPLAVRTAAADGTPGMPVHVWTRVFFTANQDEAVMKQFLPFCLKYGCATNDSQTDASISGSAHSSEPGWENMLTENMGPAIDSATEDSIAAFGPTLWQDQSQWAALGNDIASHLDAELSKETGSAAPFFCGDASTEAKCDAMTVVVYNVTPVDSAVVTEYNQQVAAEQSGAANAARLSAAKALYGPYAQYFLGIQDSAANCPKCVFYIGAPSSIPASGK